MELLVVGALIALLVLVVLPTFQGLGRGTRITTGVFQFSTALTLARQAAITHRYVVSMLLPDHRASLYQGQNAQHADKAYRAYAPYCEPIKYLAEWKYLPPGTVFDPNPAPAAAFSVANVFQLSDSVGKTNVPIFAETSPRVPTCAILFRPDGALARVGTTRVRTYVAEGTVIISNALPSTPIIPANAIRWTLEINNITGRIRSREGAP